MRTPEYDRIIAQLGVTADSLDEIDASVKPWWSNSVGSTPVEFDGVKHYPIGGLKPVFKDGKPFVAIYKQRPANPGALAAMSFVLDTMIEQQRWLDAGLLAMFRNWRNRR